MGSIRTVKPELFKHEELYQAEKKSGLPLRLAWIGLFTVCDREGRFKWRPNELKLDVLPYDDVNFTLVLSALLEHSFIESYEVDGERYGFVPSWQKHQWIQGRERSSGIPAPPQSVASGSESTTQSLSMGSGERKGKERKDICAVGPVWAKS
jgi:hypothetical protein